ncbi:MAG: NADH-quinone oxidoreductase subunit NuoF [Candidatus Methylomirabilota bacterium]
MASEKVLTAYQEIPGYPGTIEAYRAHGGYRALAAVLAGMTPEAVIDAVKRSGLRGRGGAGFPCGVKWGFITRDAGKPVYLVCNGDESEPGTFKDRMLIEEEPHQVLEGIILASYAIGCRRAFFYVRGEFVEGGRRAARAVEEAYAHGLLGRNILGSGFDLDVVVHRGAGAYICGEETGLLESLEGKRGQPRPKPPFPAVAGLYRSPTVVNNVETLSLLPHILLRGPDWFAGIGPAKSTGPRLFSVSGHVQRPGNYELPMSVTLRELIYEHAGGVRDNGRLKAVIPGGSSSPVLTEQHLDVSMDFESLSAAGSMGGSGAVIVLDDRSCMVRVGEIVSRFYHHESCGQCTQCREGTAWLHKLLQRIERGQGRHEDLDLLLDVCDNMKGKTICVLSDAAAMPIESYLRHFREEFVQHIRERACPFGGAAAF